MSMSFFIIKKEYSNATKKSHPKSLKSLSEDIKFEPALKYLSSDPSAPQLRLCFSRLR